MRNRSTVTIAIVTTDGDHRDRRERLAKWLVDQLYEMDRRGYLFNGLEDDAIVNTAISITHNEMGEEW